MSISWYNNENIGKACCALDTQKNKSQVTYTRWVQLQRFNHLWVVVIPGEVCFRARKAWHVNYLLVVQIREYRYMASMARIRETLMLLDVREGRGGCRCARTRQKKRHEARKEGPSPHHTSTRKKKHNAISTN